MSLDLPSRLDLLAVARTYVRTRAKKIDPNQIDVIGSDINLFVGSNTVVASEIVSQLAAATARLLVDGANGEELDRLAWDRFGNNLLRKPASPSIVLVTFGRLTVAAGAGAVPVNTRLQNNVGVEFVTTSQSAFGATDLGGTAWARSVQAGKANQSDKNTIVRIPEVGSLWDPSLTVTNYESTAFAADQELDEPFRARIKAFWNTARRGTLGAIEQGAVATPGISSASAVEELAGGSQPARLVRVYVADDDGLANSGITPDMDEYRAAGIQCLLYRSTNQMVNIVLKLAFQAGKETDFLKESIRTSILGTVNKCSVNGWLYRGALLETLKSFTDDGLLPSNDSVVEPAGDLAPTLGMTIRTTIDRITVV